MPANRDAPPRGASSEHWTVERGYRVDCLGPDGPEEHHARALVIATGAKERHVPVPGWTLPGVITAGGVQNLIKGQRLAPGRRALVVGNGPLLFLVAANLVRAGVAVAALAEAAPIWRRLWRQLPGLASAPAILLQALAYRLILLRAGVKVLTGWTITGALGDEAVSQAVVARIDARGLVDRGHARWLDVDLVVAGFGLMPSYRQELSTEDRWAVVAYLLALQRSQRAPLAQAPPEERARLTGGEP